MKISEQIEWLSETIKKGKANYGEFDKFKYDLEITESILASLKDYERLKEENEQLKNRKIFNKPKKLEFSCEDSNND